MPHNCKICGRSFRKSGARRQHERDVHERDVHVERPRQRRMEVQRCAPESRREAIGRNFSKSTPEFRPFGGVDLGGMFDDVVVLSDLFRDSDKTTLLALEPPTIEGEIV